MNQDANKGLQKVESNISKKGIDNVPILVIEAPNDSNEQEHERPKQLLQ